MNKNQRFLMWSIILAGGIVGCSEQRAAGPGTPNQSVVEKPQRDANVNSSTKSDPKDAPSDPPAVEQKGKDPDRDQHNFTLNPTNIGAVHGNVHLYHVNHLNRPAASDDEPFFAVWTDARGYRSESGIETTKKGNKPGERLFHADLTLRYGGVANEYDREVECSFRIEVLDQNGRVNDDQTGQLQIDGKTYDIAKGTLVLVAGKDGDVRVKPLSHSKLPRDLKEVIAFGKADADINAFYPDLKTLPLFSEAAAVK